MEATVNSSNRLEKLKRVFGIAVFSVLFFSMFASFVVSLSQNIVPVHVITCPETYQEIIQISESEYDVPEEYRIMILKHVIFNFEREIPIDRGFEKIENTLVNLSKELPHTIFYPPKKHSV